MEGDTLAAVAESAPMSGGSMPPECGGTQPTAPDEFSEEVVLQEGPALKLGDRIGRGAMGVVVAAWQRQIGRDVAIKRVLAGKNKARLSRTLRQEAVATGMLEHPNIVPVHDLVEGPDGPWMIMKRVRGEPWSQLLRNPELCAQHLDDRDPLEFHLNVLMAVCRALSYAHERGILHRDIKPDNIMVGQFGQVYLMDWGLAVALTPTPGLPLASELRGLAGTPAFMAPEMALGGGGLCVQSDVYLLGANLHYLLTGRGVHRGRSAKDILKLVRAGEVPEYGPEVPEGLATIARACLQRDPAQRPATVESVRRRLAAFLRHRAAQQILTEAGERARRVEELLKSALAGQDDPTAIRAAIAQARFGFELGLRQWPESEARHELVGLIENCVRYEVHRGNAESAAALLSELEAAPKALTEQVRALEAQTQVQRGAMTELHRIQRDADPRQAASFRALLTVLLGLFALIACTAMNLVHLYVRPVGVSQVLPTVGIFTVVGVAGGVFYLARGVNRAAREHTLMLMIISCALGLHWTAAWYAGLALDITIAGNALLSGAVLVVGGLVVDRAMLVSAPPFLLCLPAALVWPDAALFVFGLASLASLAAYSYVTVRRPGQLPERLTA
jgi:eukaryotic-like serine/threonine-protein kinase